MRPPPEPGVAARRIAWITPMVLAVIVVVSAWISVWVHGLVVGAEDGLAGFVADKGAYKVMRRLMTLLALPLAVWVLRAARWGGPRDVGWSRDPARRLDPAWGRDLALGWVIGVLSLAATALTAALAGTRQLVPELVWGTVLAGALVWVLSATVIAVVEETLVRGVLFRVLERLWRFLPAALVSSLLFSALHFLKASRTAYDGLGSLWDQTWTVVLSALTAPTRIEAYGWRFANLTLMGVVLCLFVYRTRTVWLAVGTHAAWVWVTQLNKALTVRALEIGSGGWIGGRSDGTDAPLTTLALAVLLVGTWAWLPRRLEPSEDPS